jgi:hypothetical protein
MTMTRTIATVALTAMTATGLSLEAQTDSLSSVLAKAGAYHADYTKGVSGVSLEEQSQVREVTGDETRSVVRLSSDVVLINVNQRTVALRDIHAIDTVPTRPRTQRILQLLGAPATPSLKDWNTALALPGREKAHFLLDIVLKVNEPTIALQFLATGNQPNLKFKLDGRKTMNGVSVVGVRFEETESRETKFLLGTRSNAKATGRLWIDPATGAVHQSELWVQSRGDRYFTESATVTTKFAPHTTLKMLLPTETISTYEEFDASGQRGDTRDARDGSGGRRTVELRSQYSNATFAAIDLTRLR